MFVWIFHRVSGLLLIVLLALQLVSGFCQESESLQALAALHTNGLVVCLTVFLLVFHALYGVRTILMDLGLARERLLFWCTTGVGAVIYAAFLLVYILVL